MVKHFDLTSKNGGLTHKNGGLSSKNGGLTSNNGDWTSKSGDLPSKNCDLMEVDGISWWFHGIYEWIYGALLLKACFWRRDTELRTIPYNLANFAAWNIRNHSPKDLRCWAHHTVWLVDVGLVIWYCGMHMTKPSLGFDAETASLKNLTFDNLLPVQPQEQRVACQLQCTLYVALKGWVTFSKNSTESTNQAFKAFKSQFHRIFHSTISPSPPKYQRIPPKTMVLHDLVVFRRGFF